MVKFCTGTDISVYDRQMGLNSTVCLVMLPMNKTLQKTLIPLSFPLPIIMQIFIETYAVFLIIFDYK